MKVKVDFVTNSSSVSFVVIGIYIDESDISFDTEVYEDFESNIDTLIQGTDLIYSHGDCNCYTGTIMIGTEYTKMNSYWNKQKIEFIWITDGSGWHSTHRPLREYYNSADFLLNIDMLQKGYMKKIIERF